MHLRAVTKADLEMLRVHRNEPLTRMWLEDPSEIDMATQVKWFESGASRWIKVISADSIDIGIARIRIDSNDLVAIVGLDLFSKYRGQGRAKAAFSMTCDMAWAAGAKSLSLWVFLDNKAAVSTYLSQGFIFDEREPVRWLMRYLPIDKAIAPRAYVKMTNKVMTRQF